MKLKIGVMGHAGSDLPDKEKSMAFELGKAIAEENGITITGGCPGYPFEAAKGAASQGGLVVGISPGLSLWEHVNKYQSPTEHHDLLIFTGSGLMGREVVNIRGGSFDGSGNITTGNITSIPPVSSMTGFHQEITGEPRNR